MNERKKTVRYLIAVVIFAGFMVSTHAQEVSIPDPGLNAAIRDACSRGYAAELRRLIENTPVL